MYDSERADVAYELVIFLASDEECEFIGGPQSLIRIHCGLEGTDALIADLEQAFAKMDE